MIIYFADRSLNILGQASTSLPLGLRIYEDNTVEDVGTGVNTFSCKISCNGEPRAKLESLGVEGNFILKNSGNAFSREENTYDSLYQIIETEFDTLTNSLYIYAEDAGLELLNKISPAAKVENKTLLQMVRTFVGSDWVVNCNGTSTATKTYNWDGESTTTERLQSIANLFGCEIYYSFVIERLAIQEKCINFIPKRGLQEARVQLRLGQHINNIITKKSISNLATALTVTGGTASGSSTPINLKGYSYTYTDAKGDVYKVDSSTGQMRNTTQMNNWSSSIDTDGLILKSFSYETTNKATLAGQARAELQKLSYPEVNYECEIVDLPEGIKVGDRINIIDTEGNLYLEARILALNTSVSDKSIIATIGEYLIKEGGISDIVSNLASNFKSKTGSDAVNISVISSGGNVFHGVPIATTLQATVFVGTAAITAQAELEEYFGEHAAIQWFDASNNLVATGFSYTVSTNSVAVNYKCKLYME